MKYCSTQCLSNFNTERNFTINISFTRTKAIHLIEVDSTCIGMNTELVVKLRIVQHNINNRM